MKDMKIYIKKILFCVFLATLIITPTMFVKAQSNVEWYAPF